jgi:multiple sugar transport system permease protein
VLGLLIALLLDRRGWFYNALRSVFFVPVVLSSVVVSIIWTRMMADDGVLNQTLRGLGVHDPPGWLSDPDIAVYSIGIILSWQTLGFCVVVYLAGLQGVPKELHEAAAIDGAGSWARFRYVTWPSLRPVVMAITSLNFIWNFNEFGLVYVMTAGGPGGQTMLPMLFAYNEAFRYGNFGYAAAMGDVMVVLVVLLMLVYLRARLRERS